MKKELREKIYQKYGGRCAYCGCELKKGWHVDEIKPVIRNLVWSYSQHRYVHDGTCLYPENYNYENQVPACPSCNINKHSMSLEDFRNAIQNYMDHLNNISTQYKIVKRFGLIEETGINVVFYFEHG